MTDQPNGLQTIADRYGVSLDAIHHLVDALEAGHGTMAQFNHPELGGFGQWSSGGMTMIGNMFDSNLKARVEALCSALAHVPPGGFVNPEKAPNTGWPQHLGRPATSGAQNGLRYACFPHAQRLAIAMDERVTLYDTEGRHITGVSQQQGGVGGLRFFGPDGVIPLETLRRIDGNGDETIAFPKASSETEAPPQPKPFMPEPIHRPEASPSRASSPADEVLVTLERLAELHRKGVLTEAEFVSKKAELLTRL